MLIPRLDAFETLVDYGGRHRRALCADRGLDWDILADDGRITLFEVKSVCEVEDVDRLADKVALMRTLHPDRQVDGIMVTLGVKEEEVKTRCAHYGIPLVH